MIFHPQKNAVLGFEQGERVSQDQVLLAIGHSARSMYQHLHKNNVQMSAKTSQLECVLSIPEHIDKFQFGDYASDPRLGAARYRLSWHDQGNDRGYSFCMCPGDMS